MLLAIAPTVASDPLTCDDVCRMILIAMCLLEAPGGVVDRLQRSTRTDQRESETETTASPSAATAAPRQNECGASLGIATETVLRTDGAVGRREAGVGLAIASDLETGIGIEIEIVEMTDEIVAANPFFAEKGVLRRHAEPAAATETGTGTGRGRGSGIENDHQGGIGIAVETAVLVGVDRTDA